MTTSQYPNHDAVTDSPVGVRIATEEDLRFVASTWFHSVLKSGAVLNQLPFGVYRDGMEAHIQRLLRQSTTRVVFASSTPDELLGYCVLGDAQHFTKVDPAAGVLTIDTFQVCHHIYTKSAYRRQGVARGLLGTVSTYTHPATPGSGKKFALAMKLQYNPRLT